MSDSLEAMDAQALKKYKVGVRQEMIEIYTIYANTPEAAVEEVKNGMGRDAGRMGPFVMELLVNEEEGFSEDMKLTPPDRIPVTARVRKHEPLIKVPNAP